MSRFGERWHRRRYALWAPFYDPVVAPVADARRRSIAALDLRPGERVIVGVNTDLAGVTQELNVRTFRTFEYFAMAAALYSAEVRTSRFASMRLSISPGMAGSAAAPISPSA